MIDFLRPIFDAYSSITSIWEYILAILAIALLAFRIWSLRNKLESDDNWSSRDRVRGLDFAINNEVPPSKIRVASSFVFSITGVLGLLGAYLAITEGSAFEKFGLFISYMLWAAAGIMGLILIVYLRLFNRKLIEFHQKWIREHYSEFIDQARDFFVRYVLTRIISTHEKILKPFIYLRVRSLSDRRSYLGNRFYDHMWIDGVFPGEHTSLFFVPEGSQFNLNLVATVRNIYAAEYASGEAHENQGLKRKLNEIDNFRVEGILKNLSYYTSNLDNSVVEKRLSDINPTETKWLIGSFESDIISKEVFYQDVSSVIQRDNAVLLKFYHGEAEKIEASNASRELDRHMIRQIENIVRSKKR